MQDNPFCYAPWTQLYVRSTSKTKPKSSNETEFSPCCEWKGNPVYHNIAEREKSTQWQEIKTAMIKQDMTLLSSTCAECIEAEERNKKSARIQINKRVKNKWWHLGEINQLDFRPSNLCNMKCAMCSPSNSSLIAKERGVKVYQFDASDVYNLDLSKLKTLKIVGGEPSIQPEAYDFLNYLIKTYKNLPDLHFTSNMTNTNKKWTDVINKFDCVCINMSIDGTGETFEYLRQPGRWHSIEKNIKTMKQI